jgi:two-component system CheB/CheR fusion protein
MNADDRQYVIARSLFREANDAFFLFDPESLAVVDLNPAAQRLTGLEKHVACKMSLGDLFESFGPDGLERLAVALSRTGFFHSREGYFLRRASGGGLPINISVSRIHTEPEPIGLVVARDVSDRKRAEEALRRAQSRYTSLVESTGVVVWEIDGAGLLVSLSPAFETITGWKCNAWLGRSFDGLLHPDEVEEARGLYRKAMDGESLPRFELRIRAKSGEYLNSEFLLVTRIHEDLRDRILGISRDITEQKRLARSVEQAQSLRRAKEAAELASHSKTEFLSGVSHEIRTPLSALLGFTELLGEHPFLHGAPEEIQNHLASIRDQGQMLLALIDDLLDIARIEAGQLRIVRENCSVPDLISDLVESLRTRAEAKNLMIESRLIGEVAETYVTDRLRLRQVLLNLLDNAIKFTEQGTVRLTAWEVRQSGGEPALQFEVSDTGIGMTSAEMSGLFQPFYRVRSAPRDGPRGTGLGLAICQRLAGHLGGNVTVESIPGSGSTFTLTVPVGVPIDSDEQGPRERQGAPQETLETPRLRCRILLAEDHDANRQLISLRLSRAGAEVVPARNGEEALSVVQSGEREGRPVDAVIMDMEMPVLDGYEAVRRLRSGGFSGPIIAVTAHAMSQDREECLSLGCDDHVSKPIDWDRFLVMLSRHLAARDRPVPRGGVIAEDGDH